MKKINFEEFVEQYKPVRNSNAEFSAYDGHMFETYGNDIARVKETLNEKVWTLIDGEDETSWVIPGFHFVNRFGYFITKVPWETEEIEVNLNEMITVGKAKYSCVEFIESVMGLELTPEQEDKLHDFYSQLN